ncbi:DNA cytosine methyltransferase [Pyxidicoccus sp. 3LG]
MGERAVISLFSGTLGLDLGLERAGFKVKVAVEYNRFAAETIKLNRPDIALLQRDIRELSTKEILDSAGLKVGEPAVITGGPSCQTFSTAGQRKSLTDPRGGLFREFLRVVREARPRFFVMENVRGILSAAVKHRPLARRGPGYPPLEPDELLGSALQVILKELRGLRYRIVYGVVNAADYGVPQTRERVIFIGSRDGEDVHLPKPTHSGGEWVSLRRALADLVDKAPEVSTIPSGKAKFLKLVPPGGNWRNLPKDLQKEALGRAYDSWGGRNGFCRRLSWEKPSPALTTRPDSKATMLCHPTELRPLSVREYARLQQFPDDWQFAGGTPQKYKMVGNAVPLGLGEAVGKVLATLLRKRKTNRLKAGVICASEELAERIKNRRRTILNPARMRRYKSVEAAQRWLDRSLPATDGSSARTGRR